MSFNDLWNSEEFFTFFMVAFAIVGIIVFIKIAINAKNNNNATTYDDTVDLNVGRKVIPKEETELTDKENQWRCPNCRRVNPNSVCTCGCGQDKPQEEVKKESNVATIENGRKICPNCGQKQDISRTSCFKCGITFE